MENDPRSGHLDKSKNTWRERAWIHQAFAQMLLAHVLGLERLGFPGHGRPLADGELARCGNWWPGAAGASRRPIWWGASEFYGLPFWSRRTCSFQAETELLIDGRGNCSLAMAGNGSRTGHGFGVPGRDLA
jgi:hypothetical protein